MEKSPLLDLPENSWADSAGRHGMGQCYSTTSTAFTSLGRLQLCELAIILAYNAGWDKVIIVVALITSFSLEQFAGSL